MYICITFPKVFSWLIQLPFKTYSNHNNLIQSEAWHTGKIIPPQILQRDKDSFLNLTSKTSKQTNPKQLVRYNGLRL